MGDFLAFAKPIWVRSEVKVLEDWVLFGACPIKIFSLICILLGNLNPRLGNFFYRAEFTRDVGTNLLMELLLFCRSVAHACDLKLAENFLGLEGGPVGSSRAGDVLPNDFYRKVFIRLLI